MKSKSTDMHSRVPHTERCMGRKITRTQHTDACTHNHTQHMATQPHTQTQKNTSAQHTDAPTGLDFLTGTRARARGDLHAQTPAHTYLTFTDLLFFAGARKCTHTNRSRLSTFSIGLKSVADWGRKHTHFPPFKHIFPPFKHIFPPFKLIFPPLRGGGAAGIVFLLLLSPERSPSPSAGGHRVRCCRSVCVVDGVCVCDVRVCGVWLCFGCVCG